MEQGLLTDLYYDEILKIINEIRATERENILKAARMIADQVKQDKLVYVFGPGGHSNLAAMEVFFRAGGLMHISAILNQETMLSSRRAEVHADRAPARLRQDRGGRLRHRRRAIFCGSSMPTASTPPPLTRH